MKQMGENKKPRNGVLEASRLADETMKEMEKRAFTQGDVKCYIRKLTQKLECNKQCFEDNQPFKVFVHHED